MPLPRSQLRMTDTELDKFLGTERTGRVGTVSTDGTPHVAPLWFLWHDGAIFVTSLKKSKRGRHIEAGSPVAFCVDAGDDYTELRGAVLYGNFEPVDPPAEVRLAFGRKYWGDFEVPDRRSHAWLTLRPTKIASWDFRKIPAGRDRGVDAARESKT